ncbi:MAG: MATE family efflux transporter [Planctomycetaceae bacterium]|jgi:putative MATE family efflux protein|nr:MATE family efflux transporter [Planctomycetaceae bacterium]
MIKDLTQGSPAKLIVFFTFPLLIGNLFQQFYSIVDTFIVGRTIGINALAAVGCTGSLMFLIIGYIMGFTSGTAIITAQRFGAGNMAGVRRSFVVNLVLGAFMAVVLTIIGVVFARPLLSLMQTPPEIFEDAYQFIVIIFYGLATVMLFNVLSNCLRAVGNSQTPLWFLVIASVLNIILVYCFICGLKMGVEGAALATVAAQFISGLLCLLYILKKGSIFQLTKSDWQFNRCELWEHLRMGLPMGFQLSIIAIGAVVLQFALNKLGAIPVAAFTAAQRIDMIAVLPLMSFGVTMATFTAQNYGARKFERIRNGVFQCVMMSVSYSILIGLIFIFYGNYFSEFFITTNPNAVELSHKYLIVNGSMYFILSLLFIFRYSLQGLGKNVIPTLSGVMELVMRIFAALILTHYWGFLGACIANPLAWFGACVPLVVAFIISIKQLTNKTTFPIKAD